LVCFILVCFIKIAAFALISETSRIWIVTLGLLAVAALLGVNRLMRKGIAFNDRAGLGSRAGAALAELQSLANPAHKHVIEERERKRGEHDDSGDDPEPDKFFQRFAQGFCAVYHVPL
jgi:hypothetical protein